ncbi:MAG: TrkA family potassium uptake protein [Pseudomonadales bacterium]
MAKGSDLDRVTAIVLQEMRSPLILLLCVYALGIAVMVMIPGVHGEPMGVFHAFYFMTYTATTTGFGELPLEFSDGQRMWATVCLYMSVVAWIYGIGTIIRLVQNPHFTLALDQSRFTRAVSRIKEPFFIICGFGDTGSLLARGLSDHSMNAVVIDSDVERIKALRLRDYNVPMPGLEGDASVPKNLNDAGLSRSNCQGVVLLTGDEDVNLKIAVMTRLLNPAAEVICRSTSRAHEEELKGLGSVVLADPFETFARELGLALHQPPLYTLDEWLVGAHGVSLSKLVSYPQGTWLLCGYGQLGRWLYQSLSDWGVKTIVVDPNIDSATEVEHGIAGLATRANLERAGIAEAAGVIAGTHSDADNLAILLTARNLNPRAQLIVRQNSHENELAFNAASADLIMQPSLVTARRILLRLISPLIQELLEYLEDQPQLLSEVVLPALRESVKETNPALWTVCLTSEEAPELLAFMREQGPLCLESLFRDDRDRLKRLNAVPLVLKRDEERMIMPGGDTYLAPGDELLVCSTYAARSRAYCNFANRYTLAYLATGEEPPRGWLMNRLVPTHKPG